jgi:hypothetical protein
VGKQVSPLLSIKLPYLTPPTCSAWILPSGAQKPGSSGHRLHQRQFQRYEKTIMKSITIVLKRGAGIRKKNSETPLYN